MNNIQELRKNTSENLSPLNIRIVKILHVNRVPIEYISQLTGISKYYIRQIINDKLPLTDNGRPLTRTERKERKLLDTFDSSSILTV